MFRSTPFKPNLLNTVVFLVETAQMVAVPFVNYKGRPWMKGVLENHALFLSVFAGVMGVAFCAWEVLRVPRAAAARHRCNHAHKSPAPLSVQPTTQRAHSLGSVPG